METSTTTAAQKAHPQHDAGGIAAAIGAVLIFTLCASAPFQNPASDFIHFYAGGKLLGPGMYSIADTVAIGEGIAPGAQTVVKPVYWLSRLPCYYLPFAALSQFTYYVGAAIWTIASFAGLALFLRCWPSSDRLYTFGYLALFLPLLNVLIVAQDTALLLGVIASAIALHGRQWDFCAGALIGMCVAAKPSALMVTVQVVGGSKEGAAV